MKILPFGDPSLTLKNTQYTSLGRMETAEAYNLVFVRFAYFSQSTYTLQHSKFDSNAALLFLLPFFTSSIKRSKNKLFKSVLVSTSPLPDMHSALFGHRNPKEQGRGLVSGLHYIHLTPIFISMYGNLIVWPDSSAKVLSARMILLRESMAINY